MSLVMAAAAVGPLIVGDWAYVGRLTDTRTAVGPCETDNGVRYTVDRRFTEFDGSARGTWRMAGNKLIEQVTRRRNPGQHEFRVWPKPSVARLQWLSPDHVNVTEADGRVQGMVRCRAAR
jgi:hypothetical protein